MKASNRARNELLACGALAVLTACNGGNTQQLSSSALPASSAAHRLRAIAVPSIRNVAPRPNQGRSWISPDARRSQHLLFIADYGASVVDIFTLPALALKGQLTGLSSPEGECSDASGNIWVANTGLQQLLQYSHTGTLLRTLADYGEYPAGCALNKNGDLAVANIENGSGGPGNVTVFKNASGSGTPYTSPSIYQYFFVAYDPEGDLYFDGTDASRANSYLAQLPVGASATQPISLSGGTLHLAGMVQWYRAFGYLALGDQECGGTTSSCVYLVSFYKSRGTIMSTTNLMNYAGGNVCDLVQGVIGANGEHFLAGMDYEVCGYTPTTADRCAYTSGGVPVEYNSTAGLVEPIGAAISTK